MKLYIDMGGTYLRSRLVEWNEEREERISSQQTGLVAYIDTMMRANPSIDFIGISFAGQVANGTILSAPNIEVEHRALKAEIEGRYGLRLEIDNDLNCAVMAEAAHLGSDHVAALYVGTGLGAALIDRGRLVRGARNMAFELGHVPYRTAPFACGCGRNNCLELHASGAGLRQWLRHLGGDEQMTLEALRHSQEEKLRCLAEGFDEALAHAAGVLVTLGNPKTLVLGGGIIAANPDLLERVRGRLGAFTLAPALEQLDIVQSTLEHAPLDGAKLLEERPYG